MNLKQCFFTENECYKVGQKHTVKGIMVHSTGANNPNLKRYVQPDDGLLGKNIYNNSMNRFRPDGRQVCPHAFIGKLENGNIATYQTLPFDIAGWHSGAGNNGNANFMGYVGFEICEDGLYDKTYFDSVYKEATEFCVYLCKTYNLDPMTQIICHSEGHKQGIASNHSDVMHWFPIHGKSMDIFRQDVKSLIENESVPANSNVTENVNNTVYRVQTGAFTVKANADKLSDKLKEAGFSTYIVNTDGLYKVQVGAFTVKENADKTAQKLKNNGFSVFITSNAPKETVQENNADPSPDSANELKIGDKVRLLPDSTVYDRNTKFASFVYSSDLYVREINGDRIVISVQETGPITGAVKRDRLTKT